MSAVCANVIHIRKNHTGSERSEGNKAMIKMPKQVNVKCDECGYEDEAMWGDFGSEQPCLNCDAAPAQLSKVGT